MNKNLLYLEDDDCLAQMTSKAFVRLGFTVEHFNSIGSFLNVDAKPEYSHALLDMKLEDGNSLELIAQLAKDNPHMKIVLLTGYASIATAVHAIKMGAYNYLPKPASIDEIMAAFGEKDFEQDLQPNSMSLKRIEWEKIQTALLENDGNITLTAKQLKMHRRTLQRKLNKRPVSE